MERTDAQRRAEKKYHAKFEVIRFRVLPEEKEKIFKYAEEHGESVNAFIKRLIDAELNKER